jgi:cell division protein ZapE
MMQSQHNYAAQVPAHLVDRRPEVATSTLISSLVPPPLFQAVRFDSYRPDPSEPSQAAALDQLRGFVETVDSAPVRAGLFRNERRQRRQGRRQGSRQGSPQGSRHGLRHGPAGVYLDGGYGVGKTHLLASAWHAVSGPKAYATFVELTQLAGALGFSALVQELSRMTFLAIDEFELDDPGDTVLVSTLLARLDEAGVRFAATSNTLPDRLGEGRFAADDFLREIQAMAARFSPIRVDGPDYRHRGLPSAPLPRTAEQVVRAAADGTSPASLDDFQGLTRHLASLHPSRFGALLDGISLVCLTGVRPVADQNVALRLVVFVDRLYDRQVPVISSGVPLDELFPDEMLAGGYRKKYRRALSRLIALARAAPEV